MGGEFWQWIWEIYRVTPEGGEARFSFWETYKANREHFVSIVTLIGGAIAAWVALGQLRTARERHDEQIKTDEKRDEADRQRRITESFTKAVEQLGSDKLQVRLGGIYILERLSRESELDYWPIMETLTAFVRERVRWKGEDVALSQTVARLFQETAAQQPTSSPSTDIAAVLTVINRREERNRKREKSESWRLDLSSTDLREANLGKAHLERAILIEAHLEGANLMGAHLERAILKKAHLEGTELMEAHLKGADLRWAHLEGADLTEAYLEGANLRWAHLKGAELIEAHLERADLKKAHLEGAFLMGAHLEGADLIKAHLEGAFLRWAHLEGANLRWAHLEGAELIKAHLEGADLRNAEGLTQDQLDQALGNAETKLPEGLSRPSHWPQ